MSGLSIFLFGSPRIELDGAPISLDTRKAIALIAFLATTRQQYSRDYLATMLWSEQDQPHARSALRRTIFTLNRAFEGQWLKIERENLSLDLHANIRVDVHDFQKLLAERRAHGHTPGEVCTACEPLLAGAVALYQDGFLAGFSLRDSPEFDDWQFYQADSLRRDYASALEGLVLCYSAQHAFDTAISYARRWLALDPLHELAHRHLMLLYAWNGQRAAAMQQYRECVQALEQELGVPPLEATTSLYQLIKENQAPPLPEALPAPYVGSNDDSAIIAGDKLSTPRSIASAAAFPMVGRAEEWATLLDLYSSIHDGGRILILEGDAGIGKTRLAEELLAFARSRGARVLTARCYEGEAQLAYMPVITALRAAMAQPDEAESLAALPDSWLSEATRLLPELAALRPGLPPPPPLDNPGAQTRFLEGIRQLFLALCTGEHAGNSAKSPGVLFFDDLHWADGATLEWLGYVMRRIHEQPLCLLVTWRGKQPFRGTPLHQLFMETQRSGNATVLLLSRLNPSSVRELIQAVGAVQANGNFVDHLYAETEGIPFFLVEYLTAIEKGVLNAEQGDWSLTGGIRDLLHSRLSAVSEIDWQLLQTGAIIGRSFDFDTLRETSGRSEDETVTALEDLIGQGLVEEVQGRANAHDLAYDFSHEKLRTLIYDETSLARRRLLHRRVAETLAGHTRESRERGPLAGQIASHYRLAGNDAAAAEYYKRAGEYARALYANAEALSHLQLALALGHPDVAALHEAIGDLHTLLGEYNEALASYEMAAALCPAGALARLEHKVGAVYMRRRNWKMAESHLEAALRASERQDQLDQQASIFADWSLAEHHQGHVQESLELAQQALRLAEASNDIPALAQAHNMLGMFASHRQDTQAALDHLEQSLALAEKLSDPGVRIAAINNLAQAYQAAGDTERSISLTKEALALCISQGDRHREAALHNNLADLLHALGRSEEAMSHLKQAVSIYAVIGVEAGTVQPEIWKLAEW